MGFLWVISPYFFNWCSKFFFENASIIHVNFVETRPRDNKILFKKNKVKFVDYCMNTAIFRIILIQFGKIYQISYIQEYYFKMNSIRKRVGIVYYFSTFFFKCQRSCWISVLCAHFLRLFSKYYTQNKVSPVINE